MQIITAALHSFLGFLRRTDFSKGIVLAVAAVLPLSITGYFGALPIGIAMAIGALLSSPSDVTGSLKRRVIGIGISVLLAFFATIVASYAASNMLIFVPTLALMMFGFSMISVYGFRASLIAFSGLFAIVLSMAQVPSASSIIEHALLIGCGGLWYLLLSLSVHFLMARRETEAVIAETFDLTAAFLRIQAELISASPEKREELKEKLAGLQTDINERHETIREIVISSRRDSGRSTSGRKQVLILSELIDILELGMANPVNYERMDLLFAQDKEKLKIFCELSFSMADQLKSIGSTFNSTRKYRPNPNLLILLKQAKETVSISVSETDFRKTSEASLVLKSLYDFKERQLKKIISIERQIKSWNSPKSFKIKNKDAAKFITHQEYDLKNLQDSFDFKSPIFRHSLRLTLVILLGLLIGELLEIRNVYWILLTSLVIMRPGYGLTKERSKQRLYGTLIGGAIAVSIILLVQNVIIYGVLAIISLILAFSMIQKNYKAAAAFITLNVIFVYSLLTPDAFQVIQFRMVDTLIGAGLAFLGNAFLWPTWEYKGIRKFIIESLEANRNYLNEIDKTYRLKEDSPTSYKLARKQAFLASGNLSAAFQRMTQEPKSRQKELAKIYELVSMNQEFLTSAASLGTFIRTHSTTDASVHFESFISTIQRNNSDALDKLQTKPVELKQAREEIQLAQLHFKEKYEELLELHNQEKEEGNTKISTGMEERFQELQLVVDQLQWLFEISENILSLSMEIEWE